MSESRNSPLIISVMLSVAGWGLIMTAATWFLVSHSSHMATAYVIWVLMPPVPLIVIAFLFLINISIAVQGPVEGKNIRCLLTAGVIGGILFPLWFVCFLLVLVVGMSF